MMKVMMPKPKRITLLTIGDITDIGDKSNEHDTNVSDNKNNEVNDNRRTKTGNITPTHYW